MQQHAGSRIFPRTGIKLFLQLYIFSHKHEQNKYNLEDS